MYRLRTTDYGNLSALPAISLPLLVFSTTVAYVVNVVAIKIKAVVISFPIQQSTGTTVIKSSVRTWLHYETWRRRKDEVRMLTIPGCRRWWRRSGSVFGFIVFFPFPIPVIVAILFFVGPNPAGLATGEDKGSSKRCGQRQNKCPFHGFTFMDEKLTHGVAGQ
jgi:hypothetical protein